LNRPTNSPGPTIEGTEGEVSEGLADVAA
jgi:hypothetical protein